MISLLSNILLALLWTAATGAFTFANLLLGFGIGFVILVAAEGRWVDQRYGRKCGCLVSLGFFFVWELVVSNLRVAYDVITPSHRMRAGIIAFPLDAKTDAEIMTFAALLTLTPGTLSLDVSTDRQVMYIHAMYIRDIEQFRQKIKNGLERRVLAVMR